jgi:hypothetical protein
MLRIVFGIGINNLCKYRSVTFGQSIARLIQPLNLSVQAINRTIQTWLHLSWRTNRFPDFLAEGLRILFFAPLISEPV